MNFQELLQKISAIDTPVVEASLKEDDIAECGMMSPPMDPMKQQDNVSMNISMNGSGAGGIRDLLDILRNIEDGSDNPDMDSLNDIIGQMDVGPDHDDMHAGHDDGKVAVIDGEEEMEIDEFTNEPNEVYGTVGDVIPTGNDMHSKGGEAEKVNGGGNPYGVDEELVNRLTTMYESIKNR